MKFEDFLADAERIVAEHRAQYAGRYVMKGGLLGKAEKFAGPILDTVAAIFQPELLPLAQTVGGTISGLSSGESFGKALGQGAIGGAEALGAQELAGGFGIGGGNDLFNNALGITGDNPAGTGLPNIGGAIGSIFGGGSGGAAGVASDVGGASSNVATGGTSSLGGVPSLGGSIGSTAAGTGGAGAIVPAAALSDPPPSDLLGSFGGGTGSDPTILTSSFGSPSSGASVSSGFPTATGSNVGTFLSSPTSTFGGAESGAGAPAAAGNTGTAFLKNPSLGSFGNFLSANPGAAIAAGGLGYDALKGNKPATGEGALKTQASELNAGGQQLESYIQSGQLPPGLQQGITQAADAAKASIRSRYASMGMSGSSAEAQDLSSVDTQSQAQAAQYAMSLLNTGISETGLSSQLYQALMNNSLANDKDLESAIGSFASAASGGVTTLKIA